MSSPVLLHLSRLRGPSLLVQIGDLRLLCHPDEAILDGGPTDRAGLRRDRLLAFDAVIAGSTEAVARLRAQGAARWLGPPEGRSAGSFRGAGTEAQWEGLRVVLEDGRWFADIGPVRVLLLGRSVSGDEAAILCRSPDDIGPGGAAARYQIPVPRSGLSWRAERDLLSLCEEKQRWRSTEPRVVPLDRGERATFRIEDGQCWLAAKGPHPRGLQDRWGMLGRFVGLRDAAL